MPVAARCLCVPWALFCFLSQACCTLPLAQVMHFSPILLGKGVAVSLHRSHHSLNCDGFGVARVACVLVGFWVLPKRLIRF